MRPAVRRVLIGTGLAALALALTLGLIPGSDAVCGSLLAPVFAMHRDCGSASLTYLPAVVVAAVAGAALLIVGVLMMPFRHEGR